MKEMKKFRPDFEEWEGTASKIDAAYQKVTCHMIFDVKMLDSDGIFRRKARYVAGSYTKETPGALTYASTVSQYSVRIVITLAALDGLDVLACDVQNAYLTAQCCEKIWTVVGPEFGSNIGKIFIIKMALYGLKSSSVAFHSVLV